MKKLFPIFCFVCCPMAVVAEQAEVRIIYGTPANPSKVETRKAELEKVAEGKYRFTMPKDKIPADAFAVEVVPAFMTAQKGDDGYWMDDRGTYGKFEKEDGCIASWRSLMSIFAMKRGNEMWYAHVRTWRFNYTLLVKASKGRYEIFPRFVCGSKRDSKKVGKWQGDGYGVKDFFDDYYQDIVVEFNRVEGDYNDVAHAYRKFQLTEGGCKTIKDRLNSELDYLCDAIVVRIQTHAAKPIPETKDGISKKFYKAGEELPVVVHMPFGTCEEYLQAFKDAGIDKLSFCSAGWQNGGYDGRQPWHFPICAEAGGEEAYRRLIEKAKKLGYQFALHATNTDGYMCSPKWDEDWVCKFRNGEKYQGGLWAGGQCFWVCQKCAWERWLPEEMKMMANLGIRGPHYIDVYSATYPMPCGDKKHPCTCEEIAEYQNKVLQYGRELMGASGSESGYDHVAKSIDYINYIERDLKLLHEGRQNPLVSGVYPLWELVYHGIILYTSDRLCQNHTRGKCLYKLEKSGDPRWMEGDGIEDPYVAMKIIEFGGRPIFYTYKFADVPRIKKAWEEFVPVRHLQRELMVSHREIAPKVFETAYANGERTICDYNTMTYSILRTEPAKVSVPDAEHAVGKRLHQGIPSLAISPKNSREWCVWYASDTGAEDSNNYLILATRAANEDRWHEVLTVDPDGKGPFRAFDPEVWISPDGKLNAFWTERRCPLAAHSSDRYSGAAANPQFDALWMMTMNAEAEPDIANLPIPRPIARGVMMCKPIVDAKGNWLLPVSNWREEKSSVLWVSEDGGKSFTRKGGTGMPKELRLFDEQNIVQLNDGSFEFWTRTSNGGIWTAKSTDGGCTWTDYAPRMKHTSSRFFLRRLPSGALLLVRNGQVDSDVGRKQMTALVSDDDGKTWKGGLLLDERISVAYPDGDVAADGTIRIAYDRDRLGSREVLVATFREEDVRAGKDVSGAVRLREIITSKDSKGK